MTAATLRDGLALAGAAGCLFWTGPVVQGAGYGGWVVALLLAIALPVVLCALSARLPMAVAWLTATCLHLSILASHPNYRGRLLDPRAWEAFWVRDWDVWLTTWAILMAASLTVSIPIVVRRTKAADGIHVPGGSGRVRESRG